MSPAEKAKDLRPSRSKKLTMGFLRTSASAVRRLKAFGCGTLHGIETVVNEGPVHTHRQVANPLILLGEFVS